MVTSPPRVTASPMYSGMAGRVLHGASPLHPWSGHQTPQPPLGALDGPGKGPVRYQRAGAAGTVAQLYAHMWLPAVF